MALKTKAQKIGAAVVVLILLGLIPTREGYTGNCLVEPSIKRVLAPLESGILKKVYFIEGDAIKKGQVFAKLDDFSLKQKLARLIIEKRLRENDFFYLKAKYGSLLASADKALFQAQLAKKAHSLLSKESVLEAENSLDESKAKYFQKKTIYEHLKKNWLAYQKGVLPDSIAQIQQQIKSAQARLKLAKKTWESYSKLAKTGLVSSRRLLEKQSQYQAAQNRVAGLQEQFDSARKKFIQNYKTAYEQKQAALNAYEVSLESYQKIFNNTLKIEPELLQKNLEASQEKFYYTKKEAPEINEAENKLADTEVQIKGVLGKISRSKLRSPISGIIMTPHVKEWEGKMVVKGEPVAWVYKPKRMLFEIQINEMDITDIPHGKQNSKDVEVKLLSLPGELFYGKVKRIIPQSLKKSKGRYMVEVKTTDSKFRLLPGMEGTAKIYGPYRPLLWHWIRIPLKYFYWKLWSLL